MSQSAGPDCVVPRSLRLASSFVYAFKRDAFVRRLNHHPGPEVNVFQLDVHIIVVGPARQNLFEH